MFFCLWSMLYGLWSCDVFAQESTLSDHCQQMFKAEGKCPGDICMMVFLDDLETENAKQICQAKPCGQIAVQDCPEDFCAKMTDCRGSEICQSKMIDPPQCGNLSYAGHDG